MCDAEEWHEAAESHVSCMAFKSIAKEARSDTSQEWTEVFSVPPQPVPKFSTGTFRDKSFQDVVAEFPEHYFQSKRNTGILPAEINEFVKWVDIHFEADDTVLNRRTVAAPARGSSRDQNKCSRFNVHREGSSAKYARSTCKDCGFAWNEVRNTPQVDPDMCEHINVAEAMTKRTRHSARIAGHSLKQFQDQLISRQKQCRRRCRTQLQRRQLC
eukprot:12414549-Karenia_brevis.AAC.1